MSVLTIGYEGLDMSTFIGALCANKVDTLVDIRATPLSRKPGFSKKALAGHLSLAGIAYLHVGALGCPKSVRDAYRVDASWARYKVGYLAHLGKEVAAQNAIALMAGTSNCALLCFEADATRCHRSLVADELNRRHGLGVHHIDAAAAKTVSSAIGQLAVA
jgi:uncharacterized protein (DUF488 family)